MKKRLFLFYFLFIILLCPLVANADFDGTRPRDNDLLIESPPLIRANFTALKAMIDQIYIDYAGTDAVALKADKSYVDANFSTTAENALKANAADVYTTGEIDLKFLNHYTTQEIDLKFTSYYTTGEVDAKLLLKLDATAITSYYNKNEINQLLLDKADTDVVALKADKSYLDANFSTTGEVALKANKTDVYTTDEIGLMLADKADTSSVSAVAGDLAAHTAEVAAHGRLSPVGQIANRLEVTDGAGGWMLTSVAAAGGGVTNAVDLNVAASSFSRIMNPAATFAQTALDQIDANAATTAEVAAKATPAQVSEEVMVHNESSSAHALLFANRYTKSESDATLENRIAQIPSVTAKEDTATFVSANIFDFTASYDTTAVIIYRNGVMQPRRLFATSTVSSKTRITFLSAIDDSDEIILYSTK